MAIEQTAEPDDVPSAPMSREALFEDMQEIFIENWLEEFDVKLTALDARQAASLRKLGMEIFDEDEAAAPVTSNKFKLSR